MSTYTIEEYRIGKSNLFFPKVGEEYLYLGKLYKLRDNGIGLPSLVKAREAIEKYIKENEEKFLRTYELEF